MYADQHQWKDAYEIRQRLASVSPREEQSRHQTILAFLENELGHDALKRMDYKEAARRFEAAIERDPKAVPAYLNLGDVRFYEGDAAAATRVWERLVEVAPDRAYLVFDRLGSAYSHAGPEDRFGALCQTLIRNSLQDWRARLALAKHLAAQGSPGPAFDLVLEALQINPHPITLHQSAWHVLSQLRLDPALVERYIIASRDAVFFQDPHICLRCHYRSNELLWQCPHCHEWNTFVEERLTPSRDDAELLSEPV
jgi:lipopolysaccharide assembly protein B